MSKKIIKIVETIFICGTIIFSLLLTSCASSNTNENKKPVDTEQTNSNTNEDKTPVYPQQTSLNYAYGTNELQKLDLYFQDDYKSQKNIDLILLIHGGTWYAGDKNELTDISTQLLTAKDGLMCANINYRLVNSIDDTSLEDMVDDITLALNTIKQIANDMQVPVNSCALVGYSAGAHLATYYSYAKVSESPIPIRFCVNFVGPVDLTDSNFDAVLSDTIVTEVVKKLTKSSTIEEAKEKLNSISPINYINESTVPTICAYGKKDTIVPFSNAETLYNKLKENNVPNLFVVFENSNHGLESEKDVNNWTTIYNYTKAYLSVLFR